MVQLDERYVDKWKVVCCKIEVLFISKSTFILLKNAVASSENVTMNIFFKSCL